jgi:hypothetical protein
VAVDRVGLKAKTPEGLDLENTAVAHVVVMLQKRKAAHARKKKRSR